MMQNAAIQPGLIPLSSEVEDGLADVLTFAQTMFGGMSLIQEMDMQEILKMNGW